MIVTTTESVAGHRIEEVFGLVKGSTVRARHLGRDIAAVFKILVGGEIEEYTKLVAECREQAVDRLVAEARAAGANAVVGMRFATAEVAKVAAEIVAYGTAVRLVRLDGTPTPD